MSKCTDGLGRRVRNSIWKGPGNKNGVDSTKLMQLDGRETQITNSDGFLVYQLLRGGIEDPLVISVAVDVPVRRLPDLDSLFLYFDNVSGIRDTAPRQLPAISKSCRIFCRRCKTRCSHLPCECGPADLTISQDEAASFKSHNWIERDDRHWVSASTRIAESEATYHGGAYNN